MKKIIVIILTLVSFNSYSLGGYGSLSEPQKTVTTQIVSSLGLEDDENIKYKIYNDMSGVFKSGWNSIRFKLDDLKSSKFKGEYSKGVVEIAFNSKDQGTMFYTYVYKPEVKQIFVFKKQVRYGSKANFIAEFEKRKNKEGEYTVSHESDTYGLLQEKGTVDYEFFHIGNGAASLVYSSQRIINI